MGYIKKSSTLLLTLSLIFLPATSFSSPPVPPLLPTLEKAHDTDSILAALTGVFYRLDGGIDEQGNFILLAKPETKFSSPGFNCSGLVLEATRFLLNKNITIRDAVKDRLNDSGPDSPLGQDWDFGWDLALNISEGSPRTLLLPENKKADPSTMNGMVARGFDLHSSETWVEIPARILPGHLYLASFSRESSAGGYKLLHYHVGILHRNMQGDIIITHTTRTRKKSYQQNLSDKKGLESFLTAFANTGTARKMVAIIEVELPENAFRSREPSL